jgi:glycosyltransferase involved in cell wall biosynthesis
LRAAGLVELARDADIVELHWPELGILVPLLRHEGVRTAIVVVEYDVGSQARDRRVGAFGASTTRVAHAALGPVRRRFERADMDAADLVLVLKAADIDLLRQLGVQTPVHVIEPYLDEPGDGPEAREPGRILFTGALWRPDTDRSLRWFVERVWPRVAAEEASASLTLAGAGPSDELQALTAGDARIEVTGEVPDLGVHYRRASVFVAPLLTGGGLKFKVPQAMLYGLPVVATPIAAEGLVEEAPPGTFLCVSVDPAELADALVDAVRDPSRAGAVGAAGRRWCEQRFSFARSMDAVFARYAELAQRRR